MIGPAVVSDRTGSLELQVSGLLDADRVLKNEDAALGARLTIVEAEIRTAADVTTLTSPVTAQIGYQDSGDVNEGPWWYHGSAWRRAWNMPWGVIDYVQVTADQLTITTEVDLTSLTITWTAVANRRYRTTVYGLISQAGGANGDVFAVKITDASNVQKEMFQNGVAVGAVGQETAHVMVIEVPGAGSTTRKARLVRVTGAGSVGLVAAATYPAWICVEDIGPSGAPA